MPIEVEIPSLRVSLHGLISDEDHRAMRIHELTTLEERQKATFDHMREYQKRMTNTYNKKVHPREFQVGDLVRERIPRIKKTEKKKKI